MSCCGVFQMSCDTPAAPRPRRPFELTGWMVAAMLVLFSLSAGSLWTLLPATVAVGLMGALGPVLQSHLMDVAGEAQTLAAASHHAAFNAAKSASLCPRKARSTSSVFCPSSGGSVPLKAVAEIGFGAGPSSVQRTNQVRRIAVGADLSPGLVSGDVWPKINQLPTVKSLPDGVQKLELGESKWQAELIFYFALALMAGVLLVWGGCVAGLYTVGLSHLGSRLVGADLAAANAAFIFCYAVGTVVGPQVIGAAMDVSGNDGFAWAIAFFFGVYVLFGGIRLLFKPKRA